MSENPTGDVSSKGDESLRARLKQLIPQGVTVESVVTDRKFGNSLSKRNIKGGLGKLSSFLTFGLPRFPTIPLAISVLLFSFLFGALFGCNGFAELMGRASCQSSIVNQETVSIDDVYQSHTELKQEKEDPPAKNQNSGDKADDERKIVQVHSRKIYGGFFNHDVFRGVLITGAFLLAFIRWQVGNRESAMSELFERKKEVNKLLMDKNDDLRELVIGVTELRDLKMSQNAPDKEYDFDECLEIISRCIDGYKSKLPLLDEEKLAAREQKGTTGVKALEASEFLRKTFVYIEMDNLEFAHSKYEAGLLDPEQMFRSFEIFESRCRDDRFRELAAMQGLSYYTIDFQKVLVTALIYGYHNRVLPENENEPAG